MRLNCSHPGPKHGRLESPDPAEGPSRYFVEADNHHHHHPLMWFRIKQSSEQGGLGLSASGQEWLAMAGG